MGDQNYRDHIGGDRLGRDRIDGDVGDGNANTNIGSGINSRSTTDQRGQNVVNNYIDPQRRNDPKTVEQRLDRLEEISNRIQLDVRRALFLVDGDPGYRMIGIADQLPAYIKANEDWKAATEKRVLETEERVTDLEAGNKIVISPQTALLLAIMLILVLIVVYFVVQWVQRGAL